MNMSFSIVTNNKFSNCLVVHPLVAANLKLKHNSIRNLRFGMETIGVKINISRNVNKNQLSISNDIVQSLSLPLSCSYELITIDNDIVIGPFIGILAATNLQILKKRLRRLLEYLGDYPTINGAIVVFSLDLINTESREISGFVYNPKTNKWDKAKFRYPTTVFVRTMLSTNKRKHLKVMMGNIIVNDTIYDKWESYNLLSPLKEFLPATYLYESSDQIFSYLQKYKSIFLKPINSFGGKRIMKITLKNFDTIEVYMHKGGSKKLITLNSRKKALSFFQKSLANQEWIIQQPINLIMFDNRVIDFRCIVIKNKNGVWKDMGLIGKYSTKGNIVSNISSGGKAEMGMDTINKVLSLSEHQVHELRQQISQLAIQAVQILEKAGDHLGTAGVDIGIDINQKYWLIEVNLSNPAHDIVLDARNRELYLQILKNNMLYLKSIAGF